VFEIALPVSSCLWTERDFTYFVGCSVAYSVGIISVFCDLVSATKPRDTFLSKIAGSISNEVTGCFNLRNPSSGTMALGSTQPLKEMSTRNFPGG
jgi:hypothetical protein